MTYPTQPNDISDFFLHECRERGEVLTNLKLQKLLYYAQAWYLALKDKPLFEEDFEAWVHGPVLASQYRRFKEFQWKPITAEISRPSLDSEIETHLLEIINIFGSESAVALELMTHREKPWIEARGDLLPDSVSTNPISKNTMSKFYKSLSAN